MDERQLELQVLLCHLVDIGAIDIYYSDGMTRIRNKREFKDDVHEKINRYQTQIVKLMRELKLPTFLLTVYLLPRGSGDRCIAPIDFTMPMVWIPDDQFRRIGFVRGMITEALQQIVRIWNKCVLRQKLV